ncbi:MAG: hypothetical protein ACLQU9_17810 [Acidimicrobiales bacterium]
MRANFTAIFGTSARELRARGIDPRQYALHHREQIRRFAQAQRRQGIAVPGGPGNGGPGPDRSTSWRGGYGGGRFGVGMRGGSAWIGILLILFALRFLLVDSFVGAHAAIFWVLGIGGVLLLARVALFSWLRRRRFRGARDGDHTDGRPGS